MKKYGTLALRSYAAKDGKLGNPGAAALWNRAAKLGSPVNVLCSRNNAFARMLEKFPAGWL